MKIPELSKRLMSAVGFVRGGFLADVGTDHAYLPVYLYKLGKIRGAVAADINEGPLARARANIAAYGAGEGIETVLSDGLAKLEGYHPDDIVIFGMGGELIIHILDAAKWTRSKHIRLILQPMTQQEEVRSYLLENGFFIVGEALSEDDGKSWKGYLMIDERAHVSYPDAVEADNGFIYIIYDYERYKAKEILMAKVTEAEILAGKVSNPDSRLRVLLNRATGEKKE